MKSREQYFKPTYVTGYRRMKIFYIHKRKVSRLISLPSTVKRPHYVPRNAGFYWSPRVRLKGLLLDRPCNLKKRDVTSKHVRIFLRPVYDKGLPTTFMNREIRADRPFQQEYERDVLYSLYRSSVKKRRD